MYNFDEIIDRRNTKSAKWDRVDSEQIPMWIADMDFKAPDFIIDYFKVKFHNTLNFGYSDFRGMKDELTLAVDSWQRERYGITVPLESISFTTGVVPTISFVINAFTNVNDAVIINQPAYPPFIDCIVNNSRKMVVSNLKNVSGRYEFDFEDIEEKIKINNVKLYILCNPHNPSGRVWGSDELKRIGCICKQYGVIVLSDEIWRDIVFHEHHFTSFLAADRNHANITIMASSATKTFNLVGTKTAFVVIPDEKLREQYLKARTAAKLEEIDILNITSYATAIAFVNGEQYVKELNLYLETNRDFICKYIENYIPVIKVVHPESTYLIWLDFRGNNLADCEIERVLRDEAKVVLSPGISFGKTGSGFMRLNFATPRSVLTIALEQMKNVLK